MIYFLDNSLQLQKIVTSKNVISAIHEHELNGLILGTVEADLSYMESFINDVDYFGYYYKDNYYLHKIKRVEHEHENELVRITGRHIFFEDMLYGDYIRDVRPENRDALYILNQTISANTRWQTVMTDTSKLHSETYYWVPPMEVLNDLTENVGIEYEPKILFDGQKINGFQLHVANRIGEDKPIRVPFGSRVLNLKHEVDYSEIVTALYGHGKGEEVGDGYGRRINFGDLVFRRNGVASPVGQLYMENPNVTDQYGKDDGSPKFGRVIFEDIESASELAIATYEAYMEQSRPKMLFEASVVDLGDVGMGDGVLIIRREYDVYFNARIHKLMVDLLDTENADVELGDYSHFKESKVQRKTREKNNQLHKRNQSEIERLKRQFDENFNAEVEQLRQEFEQAKIDIFAEIEANRENMETLLDTKLTEFDTAFNADMEAAYEEAQRNYAAIEGYINTTVDDNRDQVEQIINAAEQSAKDYAEQQAQEKAEAVRSDLETVTSGHQQMLDDLESNMMNIDDFLGDSRSVTLDERFQDITTNFEERIRNIDSTHFNMIRGTSFDNPELFRNQFSVEVITNELDNFARLGLGTTSIPFIMNAEQFNVEAGQNYNLVFTYRTNDVPEIDYIHLRPPSGYGGDLVIEGQVSNTDLQTVMTGQWTKKVISFTSDRNMPVQLLLGTNFGAGNTQRGILDIKKPYLTTTNNREWLPHPDDDTQNVSEIVRRVTLLEDGRSELITRSEYDFETGQLDQYIKSVEETVEGNKTVIQRVEDWQATNGASIEETIYGFDQKVWLNDVANIGANLIPQSSNAWEQGGLWIEGGGEATVLQNIRTKERIKIRPSTTYTLSSNSLYVSSIERVDVHQYLTTGGWINRYTIPRNGEVSFTTWSNAETVRITLVAREGFTINTNFVDHPDGRVKIKLEVGETATPMLNAISRIEQLANSVSIQVQELDGEFLTESDVTVRADYVQIASQRISGDTIGSMLRVSPSGIDAIATQMRLSGDLLVEGNVSAIAVDAIEGRFSNLWAAELEATTILAKHIATDAIQSRHLLVTNGMIEKIVANSVYADDVTTKSVDAVVANIGRVRTAFLTSNVIESDHIQVGTALVDKMFATSARIDELITKNHFVTNVKAMSIEAVEGQFSSLITRYLSANYIDVDYVNGKNAWFETQYVKTSNISNLTSQTAFIRDVQAIEITANQMNIQTLHSKLRSVEGGLTIYGPDGRVLINNSILRASFDVQLRPSYGSNDVDFNGLNYQTKSPNWQTFEYFYTEYKGSKLLVSWAYSLAGGSPSAVELAEFRVRGFGGNNPIATRESNRWVEKGTTGYNNQIIELGVPDYSTIQAYLEFRRSPSQQHTENIINVRVLRVSMID